MFIFLDTRIKVTAKYNTIFFIIRRHYKWEDWNWYNWTQLPALLLRLPRLQVPIIQVNIPLIRRLKILIRPLGLLCFVPVHIFSSLRLPIFSISLTSIILSVPIHKCWGPHSCISSILSTALLICLFQTDNWNILGAECCRTKLKQRGQTLFNMELFRLAKNTFSIIQKGYRKCGSCVRAVSTTTFPTVKVKWGKKIEESNREVWIWKWSGTKWNKVQKALLIYLVYPSVCSSPRVRITELSQSFIYLIPTIVLFRTDLQITLIRYYI